MFHDESILPDGAGLSNISALLSLAAARIPFSAVSPHPHDSSVEAHRPVLWSQKITSNGLDFYCNLKMPRLLSSYFLISKKETKARKGFGFF
ncbi:hypothetical protein [Paenibacillus sp. Y412MC10]|uniref:hypothetical protein n=1 Tax=Geobacillus sp. (strain Y412MC10) TaxID=481743 RepID=UPI0011A579A3|nr:hypothetical protein [Paenibacillus sp. Y412MC10]